jgi:chromosomal replication initiation ATPase DnaA
MRYGVTRHDVLSRNRNRKVVNARQHCYWHFRERGNSYPAIARIMRIDDHTTVMHGRKMHMLRNGITEGLKVPKLAGYSEGLV